MASSISAIGAICPYDAKYGEVKVDVRDDSRGLSVKVETARLRILSVCTEEYTPSLVALYGDKRVNALVGTGSTLDESAVHAKIKRWHSRWSDHNPLAGYVVVKRGTGEFVGQIILKPVKIRLEEGIDFVPETIEIGFLSEEKHWKNGYGKEFTHAIVHHLVPDLISKGYSVKGRPIRNIIATARIDNDASNSVLRSLMDYTGENPRYGGIRKWYSHVYK